MYFSSPHVHSGQLSPEQDSIPLRVSQESFSCFLNLKRVLKLWLSFRLPLCLFLQFISIFLCFLNIFYKKIIQMPGLKWFIIFLSYF